MCVCVCAWEGGGGGGVRSASQLVQRFFTQRGRAAGRLVANAPWRRNRESSAQRTCPEALIFKLRQSRESIGFLREKSNNGGRGPQNLRLCARAQCTELNRKKIK